MATMPRSLRIPPDLWQDSVEKAAQVDTTVTAVVIAALRDFVEVTPSPPQTESQAAAREPSEGP